MTTSGRKTTGGGRTSNQPTKRESVTGRASGQVKTDEPSGTRGRSQSKTSLPSQASVAKPRQTSQANANKVKPGPTTKSGQTSSAKASATTSQTSTAKAGATSSQTSTATSQVGKTHQTNISVTVSRGSGDVGKNKPTGRVGKAAQRLSSPTYTQPPPPTSTPTTSAARSGGTSSKSSEPRKRDSFKARDKGASPTAVGPGNSSAKRLSDTFGDLEAEAYKHLERLESECSRFHSSHCDMGDEAKSVSELREQYLKFLDIIRPTCSSIDDVISSLQGLQSAHSPPPSPSLITGVTQLCEGLRKRVGWWRGGFATLADTLNLFLSFSELSSKVASDLQALEDSFCETIDSGISMESAQEMLDHYQPLAAGLRDNYPAMKLLGEQFLETTSKMASEKSAPELSVGGACISVAMEMGGVEGRYPEALEVWSHREKQLQQSLEWQSFQQNIQQLSSWMKTASESFLVRFDLGTSLVTTEDLEMEFQEFKARAQVTTKEVELALAQSEKMLGGSHFAAASLRELSWSLRELLEDFTARTREREKTLHEAADFFRASEELQNDMKDVIARCKDSPSIVTIRKETSLPSVSSRLVNLQTAGTNLVSLGEGRKKGSVRGRKRKLIRSDSSGATEFSLKQTLSGLQSLYAEYKTALEGRKVTTGASLTRKGTEKKRAAEKREGGTEREVKERSPAVVLRRKERSDRQLQSGDIPIELKRKSWSFQRREGIQLTSRWENRDSNKKSTVESRSAARQTVKSEKLNRGGSSEEGSSFKRSYTLPGHFRGWRAPGLSVLEKAAAFSKVTEGTGLSAPYGLHKASATKTRRPSLDGRELDSRKSESQPKTATSDNVAGSSSTEKSVGKPPAVQTAVVKTVISTQESVKRVSLIDVDVSKPQPTADSESRGPPLTRVVSPSTQVLPLEQEAPPRVVSPEPHKPKTTATPVTLSTTTTTTSSSKSLATVTKNSRRSIQNLKIAGKVSHLKHVFDRQEEEVAESAGKPPSTTTSPRTREMEGRLSPDIVPKVSESAEMAVSDAGLTMADRPIPSPDITPKETSFPVRVPLPQPAEAETIEPLEERATVKSEVEVRVEAIVEKSPVKEEEARATVGSLSPHHPELPQTSSPEVKTPPPRPPSPIGYILEDSSDGESSYQSYDTEYSDEEEEDEEDEEEEEEEGEMEDVDSGTISRRTAKTLQAVTQALMSQELSYLQSLEILAETYLPSLTKTHVPSFLQGRGLKIFANVADLYEVHRTFYAEVSSGKLDTPLAIVESFCQALVRNQDSWNQYQTFLLNMEQGQRVLSQYGGTFFQEVQASIGDNHTLEEHFVRPRDQLMRYDRILKDVVMCAQKEYLHGVGIAKDALRVIQNILHATNNAIAMGKLRGCPISLDKTGLLMTEEFNMYTTEKKKVVREMVVFLDRQYIVFAADLMGGKEYDYWEHIETTDLHLMETYKAKEDRFALSPGPPTSAHYLYVLQPLSPDTSIKTAWVDMLHSLLRQGARDSLPLHEAILPLPYHFRKTGLYQEGDGEGQRTLKRQGSLKRSLSLKKKSSVRETGKEAPVKGSDSFGNKKELVIKRNKRAVNEPLPPEIQLTRKPDPASSTSTEDSYLYVVMEDFVSQTEGFLTVRKSQLVEVLDQGGGGGNWLVVALASAPGDLEDEGFLPARCLQPASKMGVSRPSPTDTASSRYGDKTTPHSSHDQLKYPSDRGSHDTRSSAITSSSKRSGRSQQLISQLVEDVYYSCEDTPQSTANEGLLSLAYGQSVEVLDASGGDLWLVKTTDTASGKTSEGLVQRFWLTPKPPPPRENVTLVQNGTEPHPPHQNGDTEMSELQPGRDTDRVQLRGHPLPTSSAPAAVLPGTLFGVYEPPKSMIFGKPEVNEGDIPVIEDSIKISTPTTKQVPPMILEQAPTPHKSEEEAKTATAADDELQRLQVASVNSQVQLDNFDPVEMYVAIADFDAAEDSNISLRAGEHVQLMDSSRSDWWLVSLPESGLSGWVPADYLEKKTLELEGRVASPRPEPFHDETGEIERVLKRGHRLSQIQLSRHRLYQSPFLATPPNTVPKEPTPAQMEGVFSISVPYVAVTEILAQHANQLSLVKDQPVRVLDCHRDDWWLVQTIPDNLDNRTQNGGGPGQNGTEPEKQNGIFSAEGWVPASLLQPSPNTDFTSEGGPKSAPPFAAGHNQPLWVVLADYPGKEEGTVRVWQGDLVEVIDISRNEWCLIRPVLHSEETAGKKEEEEEEGVGEWEEEGWVPAGFLKPYSGGGFAYPFPRFAPHISTDDESDEEGESLSGDETEPLPLTPEPNLTPYPDPERRAEAAKKLCFIVSELVSSEKDYVARLEFCVQNYITPAQGATAPKPLQTAELFDYLVKIFEFHRDSFLPQLVACQSQPEDLGGVFASSEESLQVYVAYCKAKAASHALLQEHRGFFEELRAQMQDRLELADYLILPVSRITKCSLLLSDFRKQSARSAQSAGQVDEALVVTRGISRQANNAIHLDMLEGLSKMEVGEPVLLDTFKIQAGAKPGSKQRQVFLFPECLLIAKRERGRSYSVKDKLMLQDISMAPDMDPQKKNLIIYDMNSGTKFTLTAAKSSMREQWLSKTQKLIQSAKADTSRSAADNKSRAASEPPELAPHSPTLAKKVTALKNSLVSKKPSFRLGSAKRPDSTSAPSAAPAPTSTVAETSDEPVEGTEYVVMECIVLEGGDDVQLEPGEVVTLVRVEGGGASLRVRTTDAHLTEGTLPATFLRKKTTTNGVDMEAAPKFTMLPSDLDLLYGTTATIACAFNGFPKPSVEWRMNRQTLTSADNRVKITSCATSSILEIIKLCYEDVGTYACFITNSGGSNSAHMALNMHGPPAKVGKPGVSKVTGTSVKLKWSPPDEEGGSPITTYQVEMLQEGFEDWQPIIQQPKTTFIVKALQPSTSYQFRVLACNQYGAGQPSDPSDTVTTKGRGWLSSSPSNTRKKEGTDYPDGGGGGQGLFDDLAGEEGSGSNIMSPPAQFIRRGSIHSEYDVLPEELGRGRFGIIHKCIHRQTGIQMVAKYVRLRSRKKAEIRREVDICRKVTGRSPYLMEFHDAFERGKNLVIVTELVPGGQLIERILEDNDLTEGVVVRYLSHLLAALDTLHTMNIAHLDIKPENLLISGVEENPIIKLIDFGSAQELNGDVAMIASSSPEFSAPEVIGQEGPQLVSDMWSVGVLTYVLLGGTSPFFSENAVMVVDRIKEARYDFYGEQFEQISTEAKEFISALLQKSPEYRMSASQALQHDWITTLLRVSVQDSVSPWPMARIDTARLKAFNARRKWHTTAVATDATAVFGPRSAVFSPIPPDFEELLGKQELPPSLYPDSDVDVNAARGSTVSFQFQVSGQPEPNVVWERGSQRLATGDRVVITTNEGVTTLTIQEVTREDEGLYVCCAMNHLGNTVQECQITLLEPPPPPTEVNGVILGSYNSALVSWLSCGDGPCPITRYLLQLRRTDSSTKSWTQVADDITSTAHVVENLERGVAYVFRVCAMNEVGCGRFSQPSPPLTITDEPDYDSDGPEMEDVRRIIQPLALDSYLSSLNSSSHQ